MLDDLKAATDILTSQWDVLQADIDSRLLGGEVEAKTLWTDDERRDVLRQATVMVFICALDLACYPLSSSAVIFFP